MQHADVNKEPLELSLLYANQTPEDILLKDRLDELSTRGMNVAYTVDRVPTDTPWDGFTGFVNRAVLRTGGGCFVSNCRVGRPKKIFSARFLLKSQGNYGK